MNARHTLADVARMIGTDVTLTTSDGWTVKVYVHDAKSAYGRLRLLVSQGVLGAPKDAQWIDASRVTS